MAGLDWLVPQFCALCRRTKTLVARIPSCPAAGRGRAAREYGAAAIAGASRASGRAGGERVRAWAGELAPRGARGLGRAGLRTAISTGEKPATTSRPSGRPARRGRSWRRRPRAGSAIGSRHRVGHRDPGRWRSVRVCPRGQGLTANVPDGRAQTRRDCPAHRGARPRFRPDCLAPVRREHGGLRSSRPPLGPGPDRRAPCVEGGAAGSCPASTALARRAGHHALPARRRRCPTRRRGGRGSAAFQAGTTSPVFQVVHTDAALSPHSRPVSTVLRRRA